MLLYKKDFEELPHVAITTWVAEDSGIDYFCQTSDGKVWESGELYWEQESQWAKDDQDRPDEWMVDKQEFVEVTFPFTIDIRFASTYDKTQSYVVKSWEDLCNIK